jgi:hypothetical protein
MVNNGEMVDRDKNTVDPVRLYVELNHLSKVLAVVSQALPIVLGEGAYAPERREKIDGRIVEMSQLSNKLADSALQQLRKEEFSCPVLCILANRAEYLCSDSNLHKIPQLVIAEILGCYISVCTGGYQQNQVEVSTVVNEIKGFRL